MGLPQNKNVIERMTARVAELDQICRAGEMLAPGAFKVALHEITTHTANDPLTVAKALYNTLLAGGSLRAVVIACKPTASEYVAKLNVDQQLAYQGDTYGVIFGTGENND